MRHIRTLLPALLLLLASAAAAQTAPEEIAAVPERSAGIYHSYEYVPAAPAPVPAGYVPFYVSHYGRHGSRYHTWEGAYEEPLAVLRRADSLGVLTAKGREALAKAEVLAEDARGRYGDLSPRGAAEHRGIAERMYRAYPEVFAKEGRGAVVDSRSTLVPRCILSMAAFDERLKELNPAITTTREASRRNLDYLASSYDVEANSREGGRIADSLLRVRIAPDRFVAELISDPAAVGDPMRFMQQFFLLAGIAQDMNHLGVSLYDLFTDEELYALWEAGNARLYYQMGPSVPFGDTIRASARPLLRNIVETAQRVIDGDEPVAASLRFGHDVYITPLLALMGVEGAAEQVADPGRIAAAWSVEKVSPMAANLQFVFFRNPATGDVRVRVLHNERDARLPLAGGPYYPWPALKGYLEHLYR